MAFETLYPFPDITKEPKIEWITYCLSPLTQPCKNVHSIQWEWVGVGLADLGGERGITSTKPPTCQWFFLNLHQFFSWRKSEEKMGAGELPNGRDKIQCSTLPPDSPFPTPSFTQPLPPLLPYLVQEAQTTMQSCVLHIMTRKVPSAIVKSSILLKAPV